MLADALKKGGRQCGGCSLCCKLLPVRELKKGAGQRCQHQRMSKGCAIYGRHPASCKLWSCAWLIGADGGDTADLRRPDRAHYVIDPMPDYVTVRNNETGEAIDTIPVVQIWVDPAHRDAHKDPALREFLRRRGEEGVAALLRYSDTEAVPLIPPQMNDTGDFLVPPNHHTLGKTHTPAEVEAALRKARA